MLPTKEQIEDFEKMTGQTWDPRRRSGRSLGIALVIIGTALQNPGDWIPIYDHHKTREADRYLTITIDGLIRQLHLQRFLFKGIQTLRPFIKFDWPLKK